MFTIRDLLPGKPTDCGVTAKNNRLFLEAVLWIARTSSPGLLLTLISSACLLMAVSCEFISTGRVKKDRDRQAIGHSRGGLTTKIHAAVDALGNPVRLLLTAGQVSEYGGYSANYIVADKGYVSNDFVDIIKASGAVAVIPPRSNRKELRKYDKEIYKDLNLVEWFFQKIKNFRHIATRYERLARNYLSMLQLAATVIWLK